MYKVFPRALRELQQYYKKRKLINEMPQYVPALTRALCGCDRADSVAQRGSSLVFPSARAVLPSDGGTESPTQPCHVVPFPPMAVPTGSCIYFYFSNELFLNNPEEADTEGPSVIDSMGTKKLDKKPNHLLVVPSLPKCSFKY